MNLKQLKELEAKATQGTWKSEMFDMPIVYKKLNLEKNPKAISILFEADWGNEEDAQLICLLRNNAKEIVQMMEEHERMKERLESISRFNPPPEEEAMEILGGEAWAAQKLLTTLSEDE